MRGREPRPLAICFFKAFWFKTQVVKAMSTSFAAAEALRIVLREEHPAAMADVLLALERARMSTEDARAAMKSPHSTYVYTADSPPQPRTLSWREHGIDCSARSLHITVDVIEPPRISCKKLAERSSRR